jgi:hypothetical protein
MKRGIRTSTVALAAAVALLGMAVPPAVVAAPFPIAKIYFEYNSSANDLGVHVSLDAEDWKNVKIVHPDGRTIFDVTGKGGWGELGMTELFFEGAEPDLDDFPLEELLELFPEDRYTFQGVKVDGGRLTSRPRLSHAIPAGPVVSSQVSGNNVVISWNDVTSPPAGFPDRPITIVGYQVLSDSFQVTLPGSANMVTLPPEHTNALGSGTHPFEVLAIEASGNQTITEGTFVIP